MPTLYVTEPYATVKKDGDCLAVHVPEDKKRGTEKKVVRVPLVKVDQVIVLGGATLTTPALAALLENRIEVCFCTTYGRYLGRVTPEFSKNGLLRIAQHRVAADPAGCLGLAREFVRGKLLNLRTLLLRSNRKRNDEPIARAAASLRATVDKVERVEQLADPLLAEDDGDWHGPDVPLDPAPEALASPSGSNPREPALNPGQEQSEGELKGSSLGLGSLRGLEGAGTAAYFGVFGRLLRQDLGFTGRHRCPPTDPVNALLSYGYVLLMNQVMSAINVVGMDPYVGYLHVPVYGRPALALDLMEEFRPIIVDSVVLTLINNRELTAGDFEAELGAHRLREAGRRTFLTRFEERLNTEVQHPVFGYKATYRRCLELQVRLLSKVLTGEVPAYPPFVVR
jgi:CRISPR-associated protein Cas1